jgi:hypothetical protein
VTWLLIIVSGSLASILFSVIEKVRSLPINQPPPTRKMKMKIIIKTNINNLNNNTLFRMILNNIIFVPLT